MESMLQSQNRVRISSPTRGVTHRIGEHFCAASFSPKQFDGLMNPLLMVDHFRMRAPTFGLHRHAGFSAVTYVFEDSRSAHLNHDSIGNDRAIEPGSLHWMAAGKGVMHDEWPGGSDPETHGLQFFVALPREKHDDAPYAVHVDRDEVPVVETDSARVRVLAGSYAGRSSPLVPPQAFSLYDAFVASGIQLDFGELAGTNRWLYVLRGKVELRIDERDVVIDANHAVAVSVDADSVAVVKGLQESHFVLMSGEPT
jgi:redox-sensitive bicupin YhaK (pirin superfamily)